LTRKSGRESQRASPCYKIFKGAKAGELPIEQPTKFELVINLKTAKALGLTIQQSLLLRRRSDRVKRREFIAIVCGAAALWPLAAHAQAPGRTYRLGFITEGSRDSPNLVPFLDELRRAGFVDGVNLWVDLEGFGTPVERWYAVAVEMAKKGVDAIFCSGGPKGTRAVQRATQVIPIVTVSDDVLGEKLVTSLAHPEGNTTGVSILATELDGKRQEILMEMVPTAHRMAALADPGTTSARQLEALQEAARAHGVSLAVYHAGTRDKIAAAIDAARKDGAEALNVLASLLFFSNRKVVVDLVASARLPAIYQWPEMAEEGGLAGYGPNHDAIRRQAGRLLAKLLLGAKPADLPVEQPTKFELVINLKTARALGLTIPQSLLLRADEVIGQ